MKMKAKTIARQGFYNVYQEGDGEPLRRLQPTVYIYRLAEAARQRMTQRFNELVSVRQQLWYEYAFSTQPWDNGARKGRLMFAMDALMRF